MKYICPKCGGREFYVTAHVIQDWIIDDDGNWIETKDDCVDVTHFPDNDDIWECKECGYSGSGEEFEREI